MTLVFKNNSSFSCCSQKKKEKTTLLQFYVYIHIPETLWGKLTATIKYEHYIHGT